MRIAAKLRNRQRLRRFTLRVEVRLNPWKKI